MFPAALRLSSFFTLSLSVSLSVFSEAIFASGTMDVTEIQYHPDMEKDKCKPQILNALSRRM
jgi:hypothetical protein